MSSLANSAPARPRLSCISLKAAALALAVLGAILLAVSANAEQAIDTDEEKTLYFIGVVSAKQLATLHLTPEEVEIVIKGIREETADEAIELDPEVYGPKIQTLQRTRVALGLVVEKERSAKWVEKQAKKEGAERMVSGLLYTEISAGTGEKPKKENKVKVKYTGKLRDGTIFDSNTAEFPLNGVIKCWTEGMQMVKVGGKAKLVCPSDIAYGDRGMGNVIPPGAALTFDVELLEILE